jgi:hypothetical protein
MKSAKIVLSVWKQGDDMQEAILAAQGDTLMGLEQSALEYESVAMHLREIKAEIECSGVDPKEVKIEGDTHFIGITAPDHLIDVLVQKELVMLDPDEMDSDEEISLDEEISDSDISESAFEGIDPRFLDSDESTT